MGKICIISANPRGLNSRFKRTQTLDLLTGKDIDVAFVQETHLSDRDVSKFQNKKYKLVSKSCDSSASKGTAILVKRSLPLKIEFSNEDESGRLACIGTSIFGKKDCIRVNIRSNHVR